MSSITAPQPEDFISSSTTHLPCISAPIVSPAVVVTSVECCSVDVPALVLVVVVVEVELLVVVLVVVVVEVVLLVVVVVEQLDAGMISLGTGREGAHLQTTPEHPISPESGKYSQRP